jgi:cell division protein FtsA
MSKKKEVIITGLDIGSTKTCAMIGKVSDAGVLEFIGAGAGECHGLRKGVVINLEDVVDSLKKSVAEAEAQAGVPAESAFVGLSGAHVQSFNNRGVVPVKGKGHEITPEDVQRVVDAARMVNIPADKEIIHVLPQSYSIDGQDGINNPMGMSGARLEVNVHIITASIAATQNIVTGVNRCGMLVSKIILQQLASAEGVLTSDEKELGAVIVDIGGGTTDIAIFHRGVVWHTAVLPMGGDNFTRDLAVGLRAPLADAERLKRTVACAYTPLVPREELVEVPGVGGRPSRTLPRQFLCEIVQPRAEEILSFVRAELSRFGLDRQLTGGVVLTGGGSLLEGLVELSEHLLQMPVRRGAPIHANSLDALNGAWVAPMYATAVGLVAHGFNSKLHPRYNGFAANGNGDGALVRAVERTKAWLHRLIF